MATWDSILDYLRGDPCKVGYFGVPGTWSPWDAGYQADVGRLINSAWFYWQGVGYVAAFGPVNGPITNPSYAESVQEGVDETVRLILARPGPIVLGGYSQGAEVVYWVAREFLTGGRLAHRRGDLLLIVTFGNPCRAKGHGVNQATAHGWGISRKPPLTELLPIWLDYALPGDMYCCADDDTYLAIGYAALTKLQLHDPWQLVQAMLALIQSDEFADALAELLDPLFPGLATTLGELTGMDGAALLANRKPVGGGVLGGLMSGQLLTATPAGGNLLGGLIGAGTGMLGGLLDGVIPGGLPPIVGGLLGGGSGPGGTPTGMYKLGKTFAALLNFATTNDHGHYHDTPAFAGTNAVAHAVGEVNRLAA
ncbi:lysin B [Mycobacterium phage Cracklewink]|nr:lysin B [Mycobacterium phage Cracklewink]